jgi:hypothetical protein
VFNLAGYHNISIATLRLFNPDSPPFASNGFSSPDPFEQLTIVDITASVDSVQNGTAGVAGFVDLGSGTTYGSASISNADNGRFVDVPLNSNALNAANSIFAFGGAITTLVGGADQYAFGISQNGPVPLTMVPEPSCLVLAMLGVMF